MFGDIEDIRLKIVRKKEEYKSYCFILFRQSHSAQKCIQAKKIIYCGNELTIEPMLLKEEFNPEWVKFMSFTGRFPAHMTGEEDIQCWSVRERKCANVIQAFQPGSLVLPDSFDDEGTRFPIVSSLEYTQVGNNATMCDGFFGQNCYKGCVKALTCSGIHRAFNNDPNSLRLEVPQNRVPAGIAAGNPFEEE